LEPRIAKPLVGKGKMVAGANSKIVAGAVVPAFLAGGAVFLRRIERIAGAAARVVVFDKETDRRRGRAVAVGAATIGTLA
jgi:hypothetical protein